ncbi:uncharacterized protein VTP21DRAFT_5746 [Calcarisporiella thermophila]|uniref:uncharacterized protein n=1 Tax=Calcarisporiella thermophila TaxID=911321 RepID=UPI0037444447
MDDGDLTALSLFRDSTAEAFFKNTSPEQYEDAYAVELEHLNTPDIVNILLAQDTSAHYSVEVDMILLFNSNLELGMLVTFHPAIFLPIFDRAAQKAQTNIMDHHPLRMDMIVKPFFHVRLRSVPGIREYSCDTIPRAKDVGKLLAVAGTVIRTGIPKTVESERIYECQKCKRHFRVSADIAQYNAAPPPSYCLAETTEDEEKCYGSKFNLIGLEAGEQPINCIDYQEIKIQEQVNKLGIGSIPRSMVVVLTNDLVDQAKSGDDVTITGIVSSRWRPLLANDRCDIEIFLLANHVRVHNDHHAGISITDETHKEFEEYWKTYQANPFEG